MPGVLLLLLALPGALGAYTGNVTTQHSCTPGFSEEGYTALVSPSIKQGQKLLKDRVIWKDSFCSQLPYRQNQEYVKEMGKMAPETHIEEFKDTFRSEAYV